MEDPGNEQAKGEIHKIFHTPFTLQSPAAVERLFGLPYFAVSQE
jgi:hypothetical protein